MLARRLPSILPAPTREEALEASQLHSVAGLLTGRGLLRSRPFRAPHHSISTAGLLGGGTTVFRPGEASLATHGVLFLDELTEFRRDAIEALRQPLEDGRVIVTRAAGSVEFPARFTLVAAANPCPCGYHGDQRRHCRCPDHRVQQYRQKLSGPLLDRIDLRLRVPRLTKEELLGADGGESSARVRDRVESARERQRARYAAHGVLVQRSPAGTGRPPRDAARRRRRGPLGPRGRRPRAHRPWVRPRVEGRPDDRRPGGRRPRGAARIWLRPSPTGPASTERRISPVRVDDVPRGWPPGFGRGATRERAALLVLSSLQGITPRRLRARRVGRGLGAGMPRRDRGGSRRQPARPRVRCRGSIPPRSRRRSRTAAPRFSRYGGPGYPRRARGPPTRPAGLALPARTAVRAGRAAGRDRGVTELLGARTGGGARPRSPARGRRCARRERRGARHRRGLPPGGARRTGADGRGPRRRHRRRLSAFERRVARSDRSRRARS